jgi:hypothetical protein
MVVRPYYWRLGSAARSFAREQEGEGEELLNKPLALGLCITYSEKK